MTRSISTPTASGRAPAPQPPFPRRLSSLARPSLRLAGGATLGPIVAFLLGLWPADDLYGTVAVLPFGLVAASELHRWARARGGRSGRSLRLLAAGLWLLAVGLSAHLGFPHVEEILVGALFTGVALETRRLVLALRPSLGWQLPSRPPLVFFWLPLLVYVMVLPWSLSQRPPDGDEPYYLLLAHSLAYDFDAELSDNYLRQDSRHFMDRALEPQPGDPVGPDGALYSRHNLLLPLLLAGPYRLGGRLGTALFMAALTAAIAYLFLALCRHLRVPPGGALLAYSVVAFAPPLLLYSHQIWVEVPAALLTLLALAIVWHRASEAERQRGDRFRLVVFWAAVVGLVLLKLRFALIALPLVALLWWRGRRRVSHLIVGTVATASAIVAILVYNWLVYDNPLKTHRVDQLLPEETSPQLLAVRLVGLFFDPAFGLIGTAPIWLLLAPAALFLARTHRGRLVQLAVLILPTILVVATRREWYGGWSPPFRYGVVLVPLFGLVLAPLLARRRRSGARVLLSALVVGTFLLSLLWLALPGWTYDLADGGSRFADALGLRLRGDVGRLLPSGVRPRPATWLAPITAVVGAILLWLYPRRPLRRPGRLAVTFLLFAAAAVGLSARVVPTTTVQFEDRHVRKTTGHVDPKRWTVDRTRFDGGWTLPDGGHVVVPITPGGDIVSGRLRLRVIDNGAPLRALVMRAGDRVLLRRPLRDTDGWQLIEFDALDWPGGDRLVVTTSGPPPPASRRNGLVLDRLDLEWR